jgi:hypothetical protein
MKQEVVKAVSAELQQYADRGIFQNFSQFVAGGGNTVSYRFNWLAESPFVLALKPNSQELELKELLPGVPFRSDMDRAFRQFLIQRSAASVPAHRRLDADRFAISCRNRQQKLSVILGFNAEDAGAAAKAAVNLLHEIFNNFLLEGPYQNYMVEFFNVPEE